MAENNEVKINDSISPVSLQQSLTIIEQMQTCVCKIHNGKKKGTGFFIKIPYNNNLMTVLITNNHVLGEDKIAIDENITVSLNNDEKTVNIEIDDKRRRYTNEILDVTIIEVKEDDEIENFLTLDKKLINIIKSDKNEKLDYLNNFYENESIYILKYVNNIFVSYGLLKHISKNNIYHKCSTEDGASGSPIISLKTNEVIEVHYGPAKHKPNINAGTLLVEPLKQFQKMTNNLLVIKKTEISNNNSRSNIFQNTNSKFNNINISTIYNQTENQFQTINNNNTNNNSPNTTEIQNQIFPNYINYNGTFHPDSIEEKTEINYDDPDNDDNISKEDEKQIININNSHQISNEITNQTIISNNFNKSQENNKICIKHLIKLIIFKKEFLLEHNSFQKVLNKVYIINSKIIKKLMEIFNIKEIITNLKNNKILDKITYENFDDNYCKILEYLDKNPMNNNNDNNIGEIIFNEDEKVFVSKYLNNKNISILEDFEIIDKNFAIFLKKNIKQITIPSIDFGIIKNNKIFIVIRSEKSCFYEIMSLNWNDELIIEYLIEIVKNEYFQFISSLNNYLFIKLCKETIQNLINDKNDIKLLNDNVILNLYSKNNFHQPIQNRRRGRSYTSTNLEDESIMTILGINNKINEKSPVRINLNKYNK